MTTPPSVTLNDIAQTLQQLIVTQQDFRHDLTAINTEIGQLQTRLGPGGVTPPPTPHGFSNTTIKLEIPRFDGSDALGWIFKINQFFDFHQTPADQRLNIASFYMEGEALTWYQWMHSNGSHTLGKHSSTLWSFVLHLLSTKIQKVLSVSCVKRPPCETIRRPLKRSLTASPSSLHNFT
jgi:hypothetical protein